MQTESSRSVTPCSDSQEGGSDISSGEEDIAEQLGMVRGTAL